MRRYETIFIIDPELQDNERNSITEKLDQLISKQEGVLLKVDDWGQKRLAYEIKKKQRGYYIRLDYCGTGSLVNEMERLSRIDDNILKYMTVLLEKDVNVEAAKEEIAREEAEKERVLKEKTEAAAAESASVSTAVPSEKSSTDTQPNTDTDIPDSSEKAAGSDVASETEKESEEKES